MSTLKRKQLATSFLASLLEEQDHVPKFPAGSTGNVNTAHINSDSFNQSAPPQVNNSSNEGNIVESTSLQSSSDVTPVLQNAIVAEVGGVALSASVSSSESAPVLPVRLQQQQGMQSSSSINRGEIGTAGSKPQPPIHQSQNQIFDSMNSQLSLGSSSRGPAMDTVIINMNNHSKNELLFGRDDVRMFITSQSTNSPLSLISILKFHDEKRRRKKKLAAEVNRILDMTAGKKNKAESFAQYLTSATKPNVPYDPLKLDDPNLKTGRHRTIIALPSYISSIIEYARPSELKKELNELFRIQHPDINETLTLSKIRNLKTSLLEVALAENLELSTVAKAYVYFEKLVFQNFVKKQNRKLIGAICLVLASKINDSKDVNYASLLRSLEKDLWITQKEIREHEFEIFVRLDFDLHIPQEDYLPHLERLVSQLDYYSVQEYLSGKLPPNQQLQYIK